MMCLGRIRPLFSSSLSIPKSLFQPKPLSLSLSPKTFSSTNSPSKMSQTIEHIVLFNIKDNTDPSKINSMVNGLNGLISLDQVLHLTAGPILRNPSSSFKFTHMLHSRYQTKEDLSGYSVHPNHVSVVKESVLPICDDIMAVDWVSDLDGPLVPQPGSAMRVTFLKLKEGLEEGKKEEILGVIGGIKDRFSSIDQVSLGENFSMARAKGFSIASLAIFPGLSELDALNSDEETEKVRDLLESAIVVDYVLPLPQSANL